MIRVISSNTLMSDLLSLQGLVILVDICGIATASSEHLMLLF
jgi:hypothetical protein